MFRASSKEQTLVSDTNYFEVSRWQEVYTDDGWISASKLCIGTKLINDNNILIVSDIKQLNDKIRIYVKGGDDNEKVD